MSENLRRELLEALVTAICLRSNQDMLGADDISLSLPDLHPHAELLSDPDLLMVAQDTADELRLHHDILVGIRPYLGVFIVRPIGQLPQPR